MLEFLLVVGLLVWVPVLAHKVKRRGFAIFLVFLLTAPIAANLVARPRMNPLFGPPKAIQTPGKGTWGATGYLKADTSIRLNELLNPIRAVTVLFFTMFFFGALLQKKPLGLDRTESLMIIFSFFLLVNVLFYSRRTAFGLRVAADAFIVPFMTYYIVRRFVKTEDHFYRLIRVLGYVSSYIIVIAIIERLTHGGLTYRLQGPFEGNQILQVVLAVPFFGVLAVWLREQRTSSQKRAPSLSPIFRWTILLFAPLIILLTWSRGNWLGFCLGVWTFLILGRRLVNPSFKFGVTGLMLLLIPVVAFLGFFLEPPESALERATNFSTVESRLRTWDVVMQINGRDLITGIGLNNLRDVFFEEGNWRILSTTHNSYLSIFVELGLCGFLLYLCIVGLIIKGTWSLYRSHRQTDAAWFGVATIAVMLAYQVPSLFANNLYLTGLNHIFVYAFVAGTAGLNLQRRSLSGAHHLSPRPWNSTAVVPALRY